MRLFITIATVLIVEAALAEGISIDPATGIDAGQNPVTNLPEPIDPTDAATKNYVDGEFALDDHRHPEMEEAICRLFETSGLPCERTPYFCNWSTVPRCICEEFIDEKTVFRSSLTFNGDLVSACSNLSLSCGSNAFDAADAICQHLADNAGLSGTYKAWLSDGVTAPDTTFSKSPEPYCRTDGLLVADSYSDLINCANPDCLNSPINVTETGSPSDLGTWSNTDTDGMLLTVDTHCSAWTSTAGNGRIGNPNSTGSFWTAHTGLSSCGSSRGLYCFQQ